MVVEQAPVPLSREDRLRRQAAHARAHKRQRAGDGLEVAVLRPQPNSLHLVEEGSLGTLASHTWCGAELVRIFSKSDLLPPLDFDTKHDTGKAFNYVFCNKLGGTARRGQSWTAEAASAGVPPGVYRDRFEESASAVYIASRLAWCSLAMKATQRLKPIACFFFSASDEVSLRLRAKETQGTKKRVQLLKVVQSTFVFGILLECPHSGRRVLFKGDLPCPLQHVDRCTGETFIRNYADLLTSIGLSAEVLGRFGHVFAATCMDKHGANERMVNARRREEPMLGITARLQLSCDIHRLATAQGCAFDLVEGHISGMIALAIAQRGS